jgi:hypothetical protein
MFLFDTHAMVGRTRVDRWTGTRSLDMAMARSRLGLVLCNDRAQARPDGGGHCYVVFARCACSSTVYSTYLEVLVLSSTFLSPTRATWAALLNQGLDATASISVPCRASRQRRSLAGNRSRSKCDVAVQKQRLLVVSGPCNLWRLAMMSCIRDSVATRKLTPHLIPCLVDLRG